MEVKKLNWLTRIFFFLSLMVAASMGTREKNDKVTLSQKCLSQMTMTWKWKKDSSSDKFQNQLSNNQCEWLVAVVVGCKEKKKWGGYGATTETKVGSERKIFWSGIEHLREKERETERERKRNRERKKEKPREFGGGERESDCGFWLN